jgi:tetratricopeptide (TPR) repeat protein
MAVGWPALSIAASDKCEPQVARIVSVQGRVEAQKAGEVQWQPAKLNDTYCSGDTIRVQEQSRAALVLINETILRLDQNTTATFPEPEEKEISLLDLLRGAIHFFSRVPRTLKVNTPFVNAAVEGTEFLVETKEDQATLVVFEGEVVASNEQGRLILRSGESAVATAGEAPKPRVVVRPRDAVQWALYYPPIIDYRPADFAEAGWQGMVRQSIEAYRQGDLAGAFASIREAPEDEINDPRLFVYRAALLLTVGRVEEATTDINNALNLAPEDGHALALQAIIAVVQNRKDEALGLATQAIGLAPESASVRVALSYAQQVNFDVDGALASLQQAVELGPDNALAWARLSELWLSVGDLDKALDAANQAVSLSPNLARTQTVLGFALLTQIKIAGAMAAFEKAIVLDQAAPLPRLGLGLTRIQQSDLEAGRREIEIAVSLDPSSSLIRSYLGKAYFEEKRSTLAASQYATAKELDPLDPTPWFYDAIRKQSINQPVEALRDLQKSVELNDNRAVYRSSLLMDADLAARSASLARIYGDLGFQQLALVEGWKSLDADPSNYSAHRFLADSFSALPRHEIARVSELLQSQLLQPINVTPVPPQLAEVDLFILEGAGPADSSFNEFNPLFLRDRLALQASGVVGNNDTHGNELLHSGVQGRISYSLGQFHFETDGFRENNDQQSDIYNAFIQANLGHKTSVQAEIRKTEQERGDLALRFDPDFSTPSQDNFSTILREEQTVDSTRFGFHHTYSPKSEIIGSLIYQSFDFDTDDVEVFPAIPPFIPEMTVDKNIDRERDGSIAELQHQYRTKTIGLTSGIGHIDQDLEQSLFLDGARQANAELDQDIRKDNIYVYSQIDVSNKLNLTAGLSADSLEIGKQLDDDQLNPKVGLTWHPLPQTTVRFVAFRVLSSTLTFSQTIERTLVAGFNQFFDDLNGSDVDRYGAAVDHKFSSSMFAGIEISKRDLEVPRFGTAGVKASFFDWEERFGRAYLYWTPNPRTAVSVEYQNERFDRDISFNQGIVKLRTKRLPLDFGFFHPSGLAIRLKATYIDQSGDFSIPPNSGPVFSGGDNFWIVDARIDYRLKKRRGLLSVGVKNLFDEEFNFQETDFDNPTIIPDRLAFAKFTLVY